MSDKDGDTINLGDIQGATGAAVGAGASSTVTNANAAEILKMAQDAELQKRLYDAALSGGVASPAMIAFEGKFNQFMEGMEKRMIALEKANEELGEQIYGNPKWNFVGIRAEMRELSTLMERATDERKSDVAIVSRNTALIEEIRNDVGKVRNDFRYVLYGLMAFGAIVLYATFVGA